MITLYFFLQIQFENLRINNVRENIFTRVFFAEKEIRVKAGVWGAYLEKQEVF